MDDNNLSHTQTLKLSGNPLDFSLSGTSAEARVFVTIDPNSAMVTGDTDLAPREIQTFKLDHTELAPVQFTFADTQVDELDMTADEVKRLMYTTEVLRKHVFREGNSDQE
jgi:hypothetical protein